MNSYIICNSIIGLWIFSVLFLFSCSIFSIYTRSFRGIIFYILIYGLFNLILRIFWTTHLQDYAYNQICEHLYCPINNKNSMVKMSKLDKTMTACFPHGIFCLGYQIAGAWSSIVKFKKAVSVIVINIPFFGELVERFEFTNISKKNINLLMNKGENIMLLPGGFNELLMYQPFNYTLYVPTGFIAMAIRFEYKLCPVLSIGENEVFNVISFPKSMWKYLFKIVRTIPIPLAIPYSYNRVPVIPYYGKPIFCKKTDNVENIRDKFMAQLHKLFYDNIDDYCKYRNDLGIKPFVTPSMYKFSFYNN